MGLIPASSASDSIPNRYGDENVVFFSLGNGQMAMQSRNPTRDDNIQINRSELIIAFCPVDYFLHFLSFGSFHSSFVDLTLSNHKLYFCFDDRCPQAEMGRIIAARVRSTTGIAQVAAQAAAATWPAAGLPLASTATTAATAGDQGRLGTNSSPQVPRRCSPCPAPSPTRAAPVNFQRFVASFCPVISKMRFFFTRRNARNFKWRHRDGARRKDPWKD